MVRLGVDGTGTADTGNHQILGISNNGFSSTSSFFHNSVYMEERLFVVEQHLCPVERLNDDASFREQCARQRPQQQQRHGQKLGVKYAGSRLTSNGNLFLTSGTGGVLGSFNTADQASLSAWRTATGQDAARIIADPLRESDRKCFLGRPALQSSASPANNTGVAGTGVLTDFEGQPRSLTTPDIGADEIGGPSVAIDKFDFNNAGGETGPSGWLALTPSTTQVSDPTTHIGVVLGGGTPRGFTATYGAAFGPSDAATIKNGLQSAVQFQCAAVYHLRFGCDEVL